jgi:hypothetical protein
MEKEFLHWLDVQRPNLSQHPRGNDGIGSNYAKRLKRHLLSVRTAVHQHLEGQYMAIRYGVGFDPGRQADGTARLPILVPTRRRIGGSYANLFYAGETLMRLDRDLQREILTLLADAHPRAPELADVRALHDRVGEDALASNLLYLEGHGLLTSGITMSLDGSIMIALAAQEITSKGLDFIQDDGGISAILGVVTVRLHSDTIKDLIEAKVRDSDLPPADKKRWLDLLRSLPADATRQLVHKLMEKGLENAPAALALIGGYLRSHGLL